MRPQDACYCITSVFVASIRVGDGNAGGYCFVLRPVVMSQSPRPKGPVKRDQDGVWSFLVLDQDSGPLRKLALVIGQAQGLKPLLDDFG